MKTIEIRIGWEGYIDEKAPFEGGQWHEPGTITRTIEVSDAFAKDLDELREAIARRRSTVTLKL